MLHKYISEPAVNIFTHPVRQRDNKDATELTTGDLHANSMKLLFFLYKEGVIDLSKNNFDELVNLYKKNINLITKADIDRFEELISGINLKNPKLIRLIGDIISDRGQNDYFVLYILDALKKKGLSYEIILSNHDFELIRPYEQNLPFSSLNLGDNTGQAVSMENMRQLIDKGIISRSKVDDLVKNAYLPSLKLVSYSLNKDNNGITLHSHAPIDIDIIRRLAKKLNVTFNDDSANELAKSIDRINIAFHKDFVATGKIHTLPININDETLGRKDVVSFLMWNRNVASLKRPAIHKGYPVNYLHGHNGYEKPMGNVVNLNNTLGARLNPEYTTGDYTLLASNGTQLKLTAEVNESSSEDDYVLIDDIVSPVKMPGQIEENLLNEIPAELLSAIIAESDSLAAIGKLMQTSTEMKKKVENVLHHSQSLFQLFDKISSQKANQIIQGYFKGDPNKISVIQYKNSQIDFSAIAAKVLIKNQNEFLGDYKEQIQKSDLIIQSAIKFLDPKINAKLLLRFIGELPATLQCSILQTYFAPNSKFYDQLAKLAGRSDEARVLYALITHERAWFDWDAIDKSLANLDDKSKRFERLKKGLTVTKEIHKNPTPFNIRKQLRDRHNASFTYDPASYVNIKFLDLSKFEFAGADISAMNLSYMKLNDAQFIRKRDLDDRGPGEITSETQNFVGVDFTNSKFLFMKFYQSNLVNAVFNNATLNNVGFIGANLQGCVFDNCKFTNIEFENLDLSKTDFSKSKFDNVKLSFKNVTGINFSGRSLKSAIIVGDLSNANLSNADLSGSDLRGISLKNANLKNAKFINANLCGVDFEGADLEGVDFTGADLSGARNLSKAKNWHKAIYNDAKFITPTIIQHPFEAIRQNIDGIKMNKVDMTGIKWQGTSACGAAMNDVDFAKATFNDCLLENSSVKNGNFVGSTLTNISFSLSDLTGSKFGGEIVNCKFNNADMRDVIFEGEKFIRKDKKEVWEIKLKNVTFDGAMFITDAALKDPKEMGKLLEMLASYKIDDKNCKLNLKRAVMNDVLNRVDDKAVLQEAYKHQYFARHRDDAKTRQVLNTMFGVTLIETESQKELRAKIDELEKNAIKNKK